jgi:hypothetical protein
MIELQGPPGESGARGEKGAKVRNRYSTPGLLIAHFII